MADMRIQIKYEQGYPPGKYREQSTNQIPKQNPKNIDLDKTEYKEDKDDTGH